MEGSWVYQIAIGLYSAVTASVLTDIGADAGILPDNSPETTALVCLAVGITCKLIVRLIVGHF
jgi:hypothetical protein